MSFNSITIYTDKSKDAIQDLISKEIKKHIRKFVKTCDSTNFEEIIEQWEWSLDEYKDQYILSILRIHRELCEGDSLLEIKIRF